MTAGSVQLTFTVDAPDLSVNGDAARWQAAPRLLGGRTLLPLRETAALLGRPLQVGSGGQIGLGRAVVTASGGVSLAGVPQPAGTAQTIDGTVYLNVRTLADALNANLSADDSGRALTLTALRDGGNPLAPQARFSTDKLIYAPGERVIYTEYAYDPDGADITARKWVNRQEAFFQPGTYTVGLNVVNSRGLQSAPFTRTITVQGTPLDSPLTYALKYADPGDRFPDAQVLNYPTAMVQPVAGASFPLLFSDSPEVPTQSGVLYQDTVLGPVRLLGYHLNGLGKPARLYVLARNIETRPVEVRTLRQGETAPTRVEGLLGQVTLLDYFASTGGPTLTLAPGQSAAVYASPTLGLGSGANMMQDLMTSGRVELTFLMLEDGLPPSAQVAQQLPYLPGDGKHVRGTFPNAVRHLRVNLGTLPARIVIGDGRVDPAIAGIDKLTNQPVTLSGNYGVLYDLEVNGAAGTAVALSPRGGLYRGAMNVQDGPLSQTIKLPKSGNAINPQEPVLLWRAGSDRLNIDFIPASGSNLPISLVFYRAGRAGLGNASEGLKIYQP
ncbi:copper amine oxidase N-terminal domain-containing protein [Deinococcus sp. ZS9-10]|uniref:Copper amine oxidase N-terminal domain-containing protein n=1 Tax=Deinococcus arenicola TaxID=2994950 RepID=A0ABU4DVC3_9DEIO|nr:copper amine oxidase N-terminal domain-containing protein [Deinococcus sp. ZS9-10]MDV6376004.1 copper amine oxidase N-terminal domain-containing protein [Deinococcus sp. ZS9-10]